MEPEPSSPIILFSLFFQLLSFPPAEVVLGMITIAILLLLSALISGSEVAFFSLTANDLEKLGQETFKSSQRILYLKDRPGPLLATILISNNFINIAMVVLSTYLLNSTLGGNTFYNWGVDLIRILGIKDFVTPEFLTGIFSFLITVVGVTFLLVLFGEVAPKVYARLNNVRLAKIMSAPLMVLMRLFSPLSSVLVNWTQAIENRLESSTGSGSLTSKKDIDQAIELTVSQEEHDGSEIDLLKRIVKFGEVSVTQIMRSRVDVVAVDFRITITSQFLGN